MTSTSTVQRRPVTDADLDLLTRLHDGDRDAFADLYRSTVHRLTRYVTARLRDRDPDAVDDVVQEAFCFALADPQLLGADLLGSMLQLAARAVTRHGWSQRRYVRAARTVREGRTADAPPAPPVAMLRQPGFSQILARLTVLQRQVIQLRYLDGYPCDRAAEQTGRTVTAVRWLEYAALRRLYAECAAGPA
jgi:RNA polymerase sigma-70 factor, ECF subfamily